MSFLGQEEQLREFQDRFKFLHAAVFIGIFILVSRLVYLQIFNGDQMRRYSEENRIKRVRIAAPRGMLFDRNRTLLVDNRPSFDVEITPQYLKEAESSEEVLKRLAAIIKMPLADIKLKLDKARGQPSFLPIKIKTDISRDEVAMLETWKIDMPGVSVETEILRTNLYNDLGSHLLGYIGSVSTTELSQLARQGKKYKLGDVIGKFGIEDQFEETLRGIDGEEMVEVDAMGRRLSEDKQKKFLGESREKPAIPGKNLVLTIDQDLQLAAKQAFGEKVGSVVAIRPQTGEILAMLSRPSFDPTSFSRGISPDLWQKLTQDENLPLRDKTIQDHYAPGSVFKVVTAVAGLEEGVIDADTTFNCPGHMRVGNKVIHCHKKGGHGNVNVVQALEQSCDIFFYRTSQKLRSVDVIAEWAFHLGLGKKTGIPLAREVPGLIPTEEWKMKQFGKPWMGGETVIVAIGQSFVLATTLQLANMMAAIGNGGTLYKPFFVSAIENYDGKTLKKFDATVVDNFRLKPKTNELIHEGLKRVVNSPAGTAFWHRLPGMDMAGKTGTSQVIRIAAEKIYQKCENMPYRQRHHGVFAAFAPADHPEIAVAVITEHTCHGSSGASPIAREIIKTYLEKYFPEKYKQKKVTTADASASIPPAGANIE